MAYEKTNWQNETTPINEENLNNLERQYEEAVKRAGELDQELEQQLIDLMESIRDSIRMDNTRPFRVEVRTDDPPEEERFEGREWINTNEVV